MPLDPCPASFNLAAYVLRHAERCPDKTAMKVLSETQAEDWSYARLDTAVRCCASGLLAHGLTPGDRVMLRLGNQPIFPIVFLAAISVGLVPVPTSAQLTIPEITRLAAEVKPALILAEKGIALPEPLCCPVLTDFAALADHPPADFVMGDPNRLAYLIYTSGTSGTPRAVAHAHRAIWARRMMWEGWYGLRAEDRLLHAGAFNWTFTLGTGLLDPWSIGATALIPADGTPMQSLLQLLKHHKATVFAAAPGLYRQILRHPLPDMPALRHGLSAGEKLPEPVREAWQAATGTTIHEALGMSECSTFLSGNPAHPAPAHSLGYAQPGRQIAVLNDAGAPVSGTDIGALAIHRDDPGLMLGYLDGGEFELPLKGDWFVTGDLVHRDAGGSFHYHGRSDSMLNAGGFRVSPHEIERAFAPLVGDCAAVSVEIRPDTHIIALAHSCEIAEATLRKHAQTRLARYKQPRFYAHLGALPRGANGKLNRKALSAMLKEPQ